METNETIFSRNIVGMEDRKVLGKVSDLRVNCDTLAVCDYLVISATTNSTLVLPFEKPLAVGDSFVTVQSRDAFLSPNSSEATAAIEGFPLKGIDVFSRTGNALGKVAGFSFDTVFGTVTDLTLDSGVVFDKSAFVFFAPEFVFVDDDSKTASQLRDEAGAAAQDSSKDADEEAGEEPREASSGEAVAEIPEGEAAAGAVAETAEDAVAEGEEAVEVAEEVVEEAAPAVPEEPSKEDAALIEFLIGATTNTDVSSEDGDVRIEKGTKLTEDMVMDAYRHGALLDLTMSVED